MARESVFQSAFEPRRHLPRGALVAISVLLACVVIAEAGFASKVRGFRAAKASDFFSGTLDGVSIGPLGKLRLARALKQVASVEEPFLLSAAADGRGGFVVGTGNSGKVLQVGVDGAVNELFATKEPEVFAVWVEDDVVYAAASPDARLYRYQLGGPFEGSPGDVGEASMIFATGERYVWGIAREVSGQRRLLLATGTEGKLLAVHEDSGLAETVYDSKDPHLRTLLVRTSDVVVGTAGEGLILSLTPSDRNAGSGEDGSGGNTWKGRTLYDAAQPEITSLTDGPEGTFFAAAVASEASNVQLAAPKNKEDGDDTAVPSAAGSRPDGFKGARSVVLQVGANGSVETRGSFDKETVYSLLWTSNDQSSSGSIDRSSASDVTDATDAMSGTLWVATGQDGKLYRSRGQELVLERDLDELQLVQLLAAESGGETGLSIATTNGAALYSTSSEDQTRGEFSSKALDAKFSSAFGTLHFQADFAPGSSIEFAARSGQSASPDDTWSDWIDLGDGDGDGDGGAGNRSRSVSSSEFGDLDLGAVPNGRYLQWRATLVKGSKSGPELALVELTYRQENRAPKITELKVLAPGVVLVKGSFNPSNQVFEPSSTNKEGIFNSLDKPAEDRKGRPKELWKLGYRTIQWKAEDPNSDPLRYTLSLRREEVGSERDGGVTQGTQRWYVIAEEIKKTSWGFDSTVLPDGLYRARVSVHDGEANTSDARRRAERISGLVVIDHSAPKIEWPQSKKNAAKKSSANKPGLAPLQVTVVDSLSPLRKIEVSRDATEWEELFPADGMVDSRRETVTFERGDASLVLLRVSDVAFNSTTVLVP